MKKYFTTLRIVLLLSLAVLIFGCAKRELPGFNTNTPEPSAPLPLPTPTAELEPAPEMPPASSALDVPAISLEELDGVAEPDDVLPPPRPYLEYQDVNSDVIGWITIPNTQIDYPVVRGQDNEYYLTHTVEKKSSKHGAIFMDFRNGKPEQQRHLVIYGHNMKNGSMFHDLNNYKQRNFFDQNRVITLHWGEVETKWEVYTAYVWQAGGPYYIHTRFGSDQNFADVMNDVIDFAKGSKYSMYDPNISIKPSDQVLTLSTCTYEYDNSRFVVSARRFQ